MDAKIIAGILAAGGAALAAGGVYRMNKKTGYFKKGNSVRYDAVSYTHLTLPTTSRV